MELDVALDGVRRADQILRRRRNALIYLAMQMNPDLFDPRTYTIGVSTRFGVNGSGSRAAAVLGLPCSGTWREVWQLVSINMMGKRVAGGVSDKVWCESCEAATSRRWNLGQKS